MSEESIGGLIMLGLWVAFMAIIIIINKRRISNGIEVEPFLKNQPPRPTGLNIPAGTFDFNAVPRVDDDGKYHDD
ncbi:MAG: hypothetical protein HY954_04025 [Deltaproteobacteria bacterium]|nr:hypothetical protein [Deltaproteobacteria bacterium]